MYTVFGIDPSYTGLGIVAVPTDWGLDFSRVRRITLETAAGLPEAARTSALARDACRWIAWARGREQCEVWIEGALNHSPGLAYSVRSQIKLAGVLEEWIWRELGLVCKTAEQSTARKLLLGKLPKSDRKQAVIAALQPLTPTNWDHNEYDALVVANWGLKMAGVAHLTERGEQHSRALPTAGFCNPKALPKGPNGRALCRQCQQEVPPGKRSFCGDACIEAWRVRTQPAFARRKVFERDKGVCALCGLDTDELRAQLRRIRELDARVRGAARRARLAEHGYNPKHAAHLWEMDHVVPVAEGGGSCTLDNLRTLCVPCHRRVTRELRGRLAERRSA